MAIEIKELHIKISVDGERDTPSPKKTKAGSEQAVIATSVEQVMQILAKKNER